MMAANGPRIRSGKTSLAVAAKPRTAATAKMIHMVKLSPKPRFEIKLVMSILFLSVVELKLDVNVGWRMFIDHLPPRWLKLVAHCIDEFGQDVIGDTPVPEVMRRGSDVGGVTIIMQARL